MKVAIFTDNDFEKVNGVTTTLRAVLEYAPDDVDVRIYTCDEIGIDMPEYYSLRAPGIGIPFYREMKMYMPPTRRFVRRALADGVELLHFTTPGPMGLACLWTARRLGLKVIGSFHTNLAEYTELLSGSRMLGEVVRRYVTWSYDKCDRIFAPSEATCSALTRAGIDAAKIELWKRGVSTQLFSPLKRSAALRQQWGASDARPAILYVGRVSREKNLALLPSLTRFLDYAGVAHRLIVVGEGPMRAELAAACPNAVCTGILDPEDVAVAMASADVFLFPSETDTAGNVVLEAQASGLPVIVASVGGPAENIRAGETGFVCRDLLDFARRASDLVRYAGKRSRMGQAARRYALTRRWETALEPLYRSYGSITESYESSPDVEVQVASA